MAARHPEVAAALVIPRAMALKTRVNSLVADGMSMVEIAAALVVSAAAVCRRRAGERREFVRLPVEMEAKIRAKQKLMQRWKHAVGMAAKDTAARACKHCRREVKTEIRRHRRGKLEELAAEVEKAMVEGRTRAAYKQVKRLAPGAAAARHRAERGGPPVVARG